MTAIHREIEGIKDAIISAVALVLVASPFVLAVGAIVALFI